MPGSSSNRISLRDIAQRAGVSTMTVSLALRDHQGISTATRKRVKEIAEEMGYQRDPLLSALGRRIRRRKDGAFHSTLAWFHDWDKPEVYREVPWLRRYWEGARQRAEELGFALDPIWLREKGLNPQRLHKILHARGIRGFTVHQLIHPDLLQGFPFDEYAHTSIGQNLLSRKIPRVLPDASTNALLALEQVVARGYRRIGFFQNVYHTARTQSEGVEAVFFHAFRMTGTPPIPPFFYHEIRQPRRENLQRFAEWLRANEPDVIFTENDDLMKMAEEIGLRIPDDVGFVHLEITDQSKNWSGIDPHPEGLAGAAIDQLAGQIFRNEPGVRHPNESFRLTGDWVEGRTVRPLPENPDRPPVTNVSGFNFAYYRQHLCMHPRIYPLRAAGETPVDETTGIG